MNDIEPGTKKLISQTIKKHIPDAKILLFGSRIKGDFTQNSDIDIAIKCDKKIEIQLIAKIKMDLEELEINHRIDLIDYNSVSKEFQKIIDNSAIIID
ncbi:MAG TPA: nucleotidyltransferase domain-containing protein [Elusimicrobiales bacterium]|nr:nucleotidyltransferase domain-containing protein [Elusimicrobiales bacterium]HOL63582.1 nucleotidyltransferase domain-containing protein [Elusimicrobiales bacterium]HPO95415.1 nucleotidyltransferase domain-containing protein [Elusimicrobiales bacterium]